VIVSGENDAFDRDLRAALRSKGVVFDDVRDFTKLEPNARGFLLGYGHMDWEALTESLNLLEICIKQIGRRGHLRKSARRYTAPK